MTQDLLSLQDRSAFGEIVYTLEVQSIDQAEWHVNKNLEDILGFLDALRKTYSTFDFQGHGVVLTVNPP